MGIKIVIALPLKQTKKETNNLDFPYYLGALLLRLAILRFGASGPNLGLRRNSQKWRSVNLI